MLTLNMLMNFRSSVSTDDDIEGKAMVFKAKLPPPSYESTPSTKESNYYVVRYHQGVQPLTPTAGSWAAQQRSTSGSPKNIDGNEKVARAARSILNKITAENVDALFDKLVTCGVEQPEHISKLMSEVFDMATKQHHFVPMYADLCMKLEHHPHIAAAVEVAGNQHNFRRLLLNQCQAVFEQLLEPCNVGPASDDELALKRKQEALGNIKLIGHLLVNGMLGSKLLVECADELIQKRATCPEALESLTALMMVAAPTFDTSEWQHHEKLVGVFATMKKLSKDKTTVPRNRFLLRDVLDVRETGWSKSMKNPSVVRSENIGDDGKGRCVCERNSEIEVARSIAPAEQSSPGKTACSGEVDSFDLKAFRFNLSAILNDLTADKNVSVAVQRMRLAKVPLELQADQFSDLLARIVEEKRGPPRRCALAFAAGLGAAEEGSAFDRAQCLAGLVTFFRDVYPDLCQEVARLPAIVRSELTPVFCSVFPKADINRRLPPGVRF